MIDVLPLDDDIINDKKKNWVYVRVQASSSVLEF